MHLIAHFNSFILVQEREFYDDLNPSYRFLNILHLKYHVTRIIERPLRALEMQEKLNVKLLSIVRFQIVY